MVYVRVHAGSGDVCNGKSVLLTQIETGILKFPPLQICYFTKRQGCHDVLSWFMRMQDVLGSQ